MLTLRSYPALIFMAFSLLFFSAPTLAVESAEICQPRDDAAEAATVAAYFDKNLKEHVLHGFSRQLAANAKSKAKIFLDQKILDKRAELCADRLKLAEDMKAAPAQAANAACAGAMVVNLMDVYMNKLAATFDENQHALGLLRDEHVRELKRKLFEIVKGSTAGLDGTFKGYALIGAPQDVKFEWLKLEATKLGDEVHQVWGESNPKDNPLVVKNLVIAREAMRAKQERDAAKRRFGTDGRMPAGCKVK